MMASKINTKSTLVGTIINIISSRKKQPEPKKELGVMYVTPQEAKSLDTTSKNIQVVSSTTPVVQKANVQDVIKRTGGGGSLRGGVSGPSPSVPSQPSNVPSPTPQGTIGTPTAMQPLTPEQVKQVQSAQKAKEIRIEGMYQPTKLQAMAGGIAEKTARTVGPVFNINKLIYSEQGNVRDVRLAGPTLTYGETIGVKVGSIGETLEFASERLDTLGKTARVGVENVIRQSDLKPILGEKAIIVQSPLITYPSILGSITEAAPKTVSYLVAPTITSIAQIGASSQTLNKLGYPTTIGGYATESLETMQKRQQAEADIGINLAFLGLQAGVKSYQGIKNIEAGRIQESLSTELTKLNKKQIDFISKSEQIQEGGKKVSDIVGGQKTDSFSRKIYSQIVTQEGISSGTTGSFTKGKITYKSFFGKTKELNVLGLDVGEAGSKIIIQKPSGSFISKSGYYPLVSTGTITQPGTSSVDILKGLSKGIKKGGETSILIESGKATRLTDTTTLIKTSTSRGVDILKTGDIGISFSPFKSSMGGSGGLISGFGGTSSAGLIKTTTENLLSIQPQRLSSISKTTTNVFSGVGSVVPLINTKTINNPVVQLNQPSIPIITSSLDTKQFPLVDTTTKPKEVNILFPPKVIPRGRVKPVQPQPITPQPVVSIQPPVTVQEFVPIIPQPFKPIVRTPNPKIDLNYKYHIPPLFPQLNLPGTQSTRARASFGRRTYPKRYTPSFGSVLLGYETRDKKARSKKYTGLELRPIIISNLFKTKKTKKK